MHTIQIKRVYDSIDPSDGYRVFVDRLWPRGVNKEELSYDVWAKVVTPSTGIRKAFNHQEEKFNQFRTNYLNELAENKEADEFISLIKEALKDQNVTLLYAAKNKEINHAVILKEWLMEQTKV